MVLESVSRGFWRRAPAALTLPLVWVAVFLAWVPFRAADMGSVLACYRALGHGGWTPPSLGFLFGAAALVLVDLFRVPLVASPAGAGGRLARLGVDRAGRPVGGRRVSRWLPSHTCSGARPRRRSSTSGSEATTPHPLTAATDDTSLLATDHRRAGHVTGETLGHFEISGQARRGRHGRRLPRPRHRASGGRWRSSCCARGGGRSGAHPALPAGGEGGVGPDPPPHRHHPRHRRGPRAGHLDRHGAAWTARACASGSSGVAWPWRRRCGSPSTWRGASPPPTRRGSSTAT